MKTKRTFILPVIAGMLSLISFLGLFACGKPNNPDAPDKPGVGHSHSFTRQDSGSEYLASEATCTEKARYYFSCECGEKGTETFGYGETNKKNHDYKDTIVPPTNTSDGYTRHTCTRCGDTYDDNVIYAAGSSGLVFTDLEDGCMVTGVGSCTDTEIYIPTVSPEGKKVYAIGERAFMDCNTVTAIHIPKYVAVVYSQAFHNANNLTTVYINSDYLTGSSDVDSVFNTPSIKKAVFGGECINNYVLFNCNNITEVVIKDSVRRIDLNSFEGCTSLKYNVKDNVKYLGNENNPYLAVMGVTDKTLTACQIENAARVICGGAFKGCALLKSIVIPDGVKIIDSFTFGDCRSLTSIVIPDGVTSIGWAAFSGCSGLTSVTIPESVTEIGGFAFSDCFSFKKVYYNGDLDSWLQLKGVTGLMNSGENEKDLYIKGELLTEAEITSVTELSIGAFINCKSLTKVVIGNSVTKIGDGAFYGCSGLKSITIPDSVTSIGQHAFYNCRGLKSVTIPDSVISIGGYAFYNCSGLKNITIPDGVTSIGNYTFYECSGLTSVTIGKGVTSINESAFYYCYKLVEVVNNSSLNITKGSSDYGKVAEHALNVKQGGNSDIVNQNGYLFYTYDGSNYLIGYAGSETDLILPENYNGKNYEIYKKAFYNCSGLTSITIPDSVTSIGEAALRGCSGLTSVTIGNGVTSIGWAAFSGSRSLTSVTIGNGVTSISDYAFEDCSGLASVTIGKGVTFINKSAFFNCYKLVEVINNSSLNIRKGSWDYGEVAKHALNVKQGGNSDIVNQNGYLFYTYDGSDYLIGYAGSDTDLILPENYNGKNYEIYKYAFYNCRELTSVTIPDSITSIGEAAFSGCIDLKYNEYDNAYYLGNESNPYVFLIKAKTKNVETCSINKNTKVICDSAFFGCRELTSVTIPDSVTSIGEYAFCGCRGLTSVTIGSGVTSIGEAAFRECSGLTSVTIGSGVTSIGDYAFYICGELTSVTIPDSVTSIGDYAFRECSELTSVTIGSGVTSIGKDAFSGCSRLTSVTIPDSVTSIGEAAFRECSGLTSVTIPDSVTSIGGRAFSGCSGLTSITIPDSVTSIGDDAFRECSELTSVTIGSGVTSIGSFAFENCSGLKEIHYKGTIKEWNGVKKGFKCDYNTGKYTVFCTDGNISK